MDFVALRVPKQKMLGIQEAICAPGLSSFAEHLEKALPSKAEAYTCVPLSLRPDPGPEDRDGQERGTAVFHEDVHGLAEVLHLQDEVCGVTGALAEGGPLLLFCHHSAAAATHRGLGCSPSGPSGRALAPPSSHPTLSDFCSVLGWLPLSPRSQLPAGPSTSPGSVFLNIVYGRSIDFILTLMFPVSNHTF